MSDFTFYFTLGWHHIISWDAADHILFIIALASIYLVNDWKQVLILVTAFTIGHSITLALSVYKVLTVKSNLVEFLIPVTIFATAVYNIFQKEMKVGRIRVNYLFALFFGLIHGLGFANSIRFILADNESIGWPLFGFNVGLEAGQIIVVLLLLGLSYLLVSRAGFRRKWWITTFSLVIGSLALYMMIERWPSQTNCILFI